MEVFKIKSIVQLKYDSWSNQITVKESIEVLDKNEYYEAKFKYNNGYIRTEYFIEKTELGVPYKYFCSKDNILYISGTKYHENPQYWQKLVKEYKYKKIVK